MPGRQHARDYEDDATATSLVGLAEIMTALGAYRDALVLIGGWAPYLILRNFGEPPEFDPREFDPKEFATGFAHIGSIDIDFVVDPDAVDANQYATIVELLLARGYEPPAESMFQLQKMISSLQTGQQHLIRVDLLTPKPLRGQGRPRRHRQVQHDLHARTLAGAEVALTHWFWHEFEAQLPDGARAHVRVKVADIVASLALKGLAIGDRYAEKDAYDIFALCAHYLGGPAAVADAIRAFRDEDPVRRALDAIREKFRDREAEGPTWVAVFLSEGDPAADERFRTDAFMTVSEVLRLVG